MDKKVITPFRLLTEVVGLKPQERIIYYEGSFLQDCITYPELALKITHLLETAQELEEAKVVLLASRSIFEKISHYYIIKAKENLVPPQWIINNVDRRMKESWTNTPTNTQT